MAPLEMPDRVAALVSAFLVEPVDTSCAAWFATCQAAASPYARQELAKERDRRDASVQDALQALQSEFRDLMEPYARRVWFRYLNDDANAAEDATRACVLLIDDVLWELEARRGGSLPERLALAREIEAKLAGAVLRDSPLRAPIHEACLRFHGAL
jgi:hypothetical protein